MSRPIDADHVISATRECILRHGAKGITITQVAAEAGISRMTIYRRWKTIDRLIIETMDKEIRQCMSQALRRVNTGNARQRCVALLIESLELFHKNEIIHICLQEDYSIFQRYIIERTGKVQNTAINLLSRYITAGIQDASIGRKDVSATAYVLLITLQNFISSYDILCKETNYEQVLHELRQMLDAYLRSRGSSERTMRTSRFSHGF